MGTPEDSPLSILRSVIPSLAGKRILDIGCGSGALAAVFAAEGADVIGIDPNPVAIAAARKQNSGIRFEIGIAEALPFPDDTFDSTIIINALHHVPAASMDQALAEVRRVTKPAGFLLIIEPLAEGSYFNAVRMVDDETEIRALAQQALANAVNRAVFQRVAGKTYIRHERFADAAAVLKRIVAVSPSRQAVIDANRDAITSAVLAAAARDTDGLLAFEQPLKADLLRKAG